MIKKFIHQQFNTPEITVGEVTLIVITIINVITIMLSTMGSFSLNYSTFISVVEYSSLVIFSIEYLLRLYACGEVERYRGFFGCIRYIFSIQSIINLLSIVPVFIINNDDIIIVFRLFRILKLMEYTNAFKMMFDVIRNKRQELLITFSIVLFLIVLSSSIMYFAEHSAQPDKFTSIPGTMYWAVATLTTIGYGDIFPITNIGRILTSFIAILGVAIFALPAGIFASGFSELSSKNEIFMPLHERLRELNKLREEGILTEEEYVKQKEKILI